MLTRNNVASILGISVAKVRRMEGKDLHPRLVDGKWLFDLAEVRRLQESPTRALTAGELAAEVFRRFDQGQSIRQIVREYEQPPELVLSLYRYWATPLGEAPEESASEHRARLRQDEQDLVRWEEAMRAMMAADEEQDRQDHLAREDRRERHARPSRRCP